MTVRHFVTANTSKPIQRVSLGLHLRSTRARSWTVVSCTHGAFKILDIPPCDDSSFKSATVLNRAVVQAAWAHHSPDHHVKLSLLLFSLCKASHIVKRFCTVLGREGAWPGLARATGAPASVLAGRCLSHEPGRAAAACSSWLVCLASF